MFKSNPINNISNRMWYRKTNPYQPSHVIICFKIKMRLCHLGFRKEMRIPFGHQVDLRETMNKLHQTSSILTFLNHISPFKGSRVARHMKSSVIYDCTLLTLTLKPSKSMQKYVQLRGCILRISRGRHPTCEPSSHLLHHHGKEGLGNCSV